MTMIKIIELGEVRSRTLDLPDEITVDQLIEGLWAALKIVQPTQPPAPPPPPQPTPEQIVAAARAAAHGQYATLFEKYAKRPMNSDDEQDFENRWRQSRESGQYQDPAYAKTWTEVLAAAELELDAKFRN